MSQEAALFAFATLVSWIFAIILAKEFIDNMEQKHSWIFAALSMICAFLGGAVWLFYG